jgi:DUF1680 family protein
MTDVWAETGEPPLGEAVEHLWRSAFTRKAYVTGGLGSRWAGEAFGADYELPAERAYAETCAAIGGVMWNWRRLLLSGEARFADWMETALYNGVLAGVALSGTEFFYQNPLADRGGHRRLPWFRTPCCPTNVPRALLALPGQLYTTSEDGLWVHLYAAGGVRAAVGAGVLTLRVETRYPWDGTVRLEVREAPPGPCSLHLRIPPWAEGARLVAPGAARASDPVPGSYAEVRHRWGPGDAVELTLPLRIRRVASHPRVLANSGRVALARGPLVYCVEAVDHPGVDVWDLGLPEGNRLEAAERPELLGGVVALTGEAVEAPSAGWGDGLYAPAERAPVPARRPVPLRAIPYFAWANRAAGPMQVWLPRL